MACLSSSIYAAKTSPSSMIWKPNGKTPRRIRIFDFEVENTTIESAVGFLVRAARERVVTTVAFLNAHSVNSAIKNLPYARVLAAADLRYADGSGMALAAKLLGSPLADNVNGTDMLPVLASEAARLGLSLYLLGGRDGIAVAAAKALESRFPQLKIAGTSHGYFKQGSEDESRVIADINASRADILLVGLGVPQQDIWLARNRRLLLPPVRMGVGGLFDFAAGVVPRAPKLLRKQGFEWVWRLYQEPGRMWRRYLVGNVLFATRTMRCLAARWIETGSTNPLWTKRAQRAERRDLLAKQFDAKRLFDITASGLGLIAISPLLAAIALAIRLDSPGAAIYKQKRVGLNGRQFMMFKFRSMVEGADKLHQQMQGTVRSAHDIRFKAKCDPRVTRVGRFIRRWSLDELPQIFNVLIGDMSLVGPRPALPSEVAHYDHRDRDRLLRTPGITGSWQVNGRADIDFVGQMELDRDYVRRTSLGLDFNILLRTLPAILAGRGAY